MAALVLLVLGLVSGLTAVPAGAAVVKLGSEEVGLQQRSLVFMNGSWGWNADEEEFTNPSSFKFANPGGEPVLPATHVYAIYWDPKGTLYNGDWQEVINDFLTRMGSASGSLASVFAVDAQYTDRENQHASYNSTFMGAYTDTDRYPPVECVDPRPLEGETQPDFTNAAVTCLTDKQIREELKLFIAAHNNLPKGMGTVYYLLTPPGVTVCVTEGHCSDYAKVLYSGTETKTEREAKEIKEKENEERSFCSYHADFDAETGRSDSQGEPSTILYAVIPWTAGVLADGHYPETDWSQEVACQDGGFNPASKPVEQHEKSREETQKQEEEEAEKQTPSEKRAKEKAKLLEGPHVQEPNQPTQRDPDGYYDQGLADLIVNQIAAEQQDIVTDPLLHSWRGQEDVKLRDAEEVSLEAVDECRDYFAPTLGGSVTATETADAGTLFNQQLSGGSYYLNDAFDLAALELPYPGVPCRTGVDLEPQFSSPDPVNAGELIGFDGMESNVTLNWGTEYEAGGEAKPTYAMYTWNFGDPDAADGPDEVTGYAPGAPPGEEPSSICEEPWRAPCAASVFHAYHYGGTYEVTLTVTDTGGNTAQIRHQVTVVGPPPPAGGGSGGGGGSGSGSGGGGAPQTTPPASQSPAKPVVTIPGPVATAAAATGSLAQVARNGLVVHYSVNEQVAGRFEVLLPASVARRLKIAGRTATGLPAGFPKSVVIGQALVVTTKGGHNSVRIKFPKRTAKRLRHAHSVTLTLRMIVHNAGKSPLSTTVTSTVVLHG